MDSLVVELAEMSGSTVLAEVMKVFTDDMWSVKLLSIAPIISCGPQDVSGSKKAVITVILSPNPKL